MLQNIALNSCLINSNSRKLMIVIAKINKKVYNYIFEVLWKSHFIDFFFRISPLGSQIQTLHFALTFHGYFAI